MFTAFPQSSFSGSTSIDFAIKNLNAIFREALLLSTFLSYPVFFFPRRQVLFPSSREKMHINQTRLIWKLPEFTFKNFLLFCTFSFRCDVNKFQQVRICLKKNAFVFANDLRLLNLILRFRPLNSRLPFVILIAEKNCYWITCKLLRAKMYVQLSRKESNFKILQ